MSARRRGGEAEHVTVTAIVLAGGRSSRFGGDKLAADLGGRSVLARTVEVVRTVADETIVVGRTGDLPGVSYLADERPFDGPLAGLATGLRAVSGEIALVVAGDMALADVNLLRHLLAELGATDRPAVAIRESGSIRPLPLAVRRPDASAAAETALAGGQRSLRAVLDGLELVVVEEPAWRALDPDGDTLLDVDTPDDLLHVRARFAERL
jgi:molybdopterin-guanine dinucleotide biosynthesis protein A